jgi:polyisoprenoid-binding protein YceI
VRSMDWRAATAALAIVAFGAACAGADSAGTTASSAGVPPAQAAVATSTPPTVAVSTPTGAAPASTPTAAAVAKPLAAAVPNTPAPAAPAKASTASADAPAKASTASADANSFAIVAEASEARYRVTEQLAGRSLPNDAVGTTKAVAGAIVIGADGAVVAEQSKITVDLSKLESDSGQRDNFVKRNTLQVSQFPNATFVPTKVEGLSRPLPTSGEVRFTLSGDLTVRGVTKPVTWDVVAQAGAQQVSGTATTTVTFQDFGMTPPKVGPVLGVEDQLTLEMDFRANRGGAA